MKRLLSVLLAAAVICSLCASVPYFAGAETLTSSDAFIELLKAREGFEAKPYWDVSHWAIGYGTQISEAEAEYYKKNPISEEKAEEMMRKKLVGFENSVLNFAAKYNLNLSQNQFDALVSFTYNCGDSWLRETDGNLNKAVREGWTGSDFLYAICLWSKAGGKNILIDRRLYEASMYIDGVYQNKYDHVNGTFSYVILDAGKGTVRYNIHGYDTRDPKPIRAEITKAPTGVDGAGNVFTYEFAGWYTKAVDGESVEILDGSLPFGTMLLAMWKDPDGNLTSLDAWVENGTVNANGVNVRSAAGTSNSSQYKLNDGDAVKITQRAYVDKLYWGKLEDGNWIALKYVDFEQTESKPADPIISADVNGSGAVDKDDAIYLLRHVVYPEKYPVKAVCDADGSGSVDKDDAIYLLRHVVYPEKYPLKLGE